MGDKGPQSCVIKVLPKLAADKTGAGGKGLEGDRKLGFKFSGLGQVGLKNGRLRAWAERIGSDMEMIIISIL
jgi:hypothetical protein